MNNQSLTISEVLRFANHDYVNQLQLIRMNLDLGRIEESKNLFNIIQNNYECFLSSIDYNYHKQLNGFKQQDGVTHH